MITYGYNSDTNLSQIYNRDPDNAVAFETTKLDFYESNRLAFAVDAIWKQAYEQGAADLAEKVRRALPATPALAAGGVDSSDQPAGDACRINVRHP